MTIREARRFAQDTTSILNDLWGLSLKPTHKLKILKQKPDVSMMIYRRLSFIFLLASAASTHGVAEQEKQQGMEEYAVLAGKGLCYREVYLNCFNISKTECKTDIESLQNQCLSLVKKNSPHMGPLDVNRHLVCLTEKHKALYESTGRRMSDSCLAEFMNYLYLPPE